MPSKCDNKNWPGQDDKPATSYVLRYMLWGCRWWYQQVSCVKKTICTDYKYSHHLLLHNICCLSGQIFRVYTQSVEGGRFVVLQTEWKTLTPVTTLPWPWVCIMCLGEIFIIICSTVPLWAGTTTWPIESYHTCSYNIDLI